MKYLFALLILGFVSCATSKDGAKTEKDKTTKYTVSGKIVAHHGYCGGVQPTPEQQRGYNKPMPIEEYIVKDSLGNKVATFKGTEASYSIDLAPGTYRFYNAEKELPLAKFKELNGLKEGTGLYHKLRDDQCFIDWQNRPDLTIKVEKQSVEKDIVYYHRCYTGTNPCIQYNGPIAP